MVLPVLCLLLFAIIQFGLTLNNYIELANGVSAGARQLSISRGAGAPYSSTVTAIDNASPNLQSSKISITVSVNGTACTTDASCITEFGLNGGNGGGQALVTTTYPCNLNVMQIKVTSCKLSSSASEIIQ